MFGSELRHRLVLGHGMVSDDTEHTLFVSQSLLAHPDSAEHFANRLAWCLRGWLLALPAGIGLATLRATLKLWLGFPPHRSGVYSAGNAPAMRAAPIGAYFASDRAEMEKFLAACTHITHTDPKALTGAAAVALVVARSIKDKLRNRPALDEFLELLRSAGTEDREWHDRLRSIREAYEGDFSVPDFAATLGCQDGVTGYVYHTVPVAVYGWFRHFGDFDGTLAAVIRCGGDTDTSGAIAGAMAGAVVGEAGIPEAWIRGIVDWPRSTSVLRAVADRLAGQSQRPGRASPVGYLWPAVPLRNLGFLVVVLLHGLRRLAPPY